MSGIRGILLAAGASQRFGANKLLYPLPAGTDQAGTPIALAAARNLAAALPNPVAVVRPGAKKLAQLLREAGCEVVTCRNAGEGMGRSLASGVRASRDASGWVVALADMPFVRPQTIRSIADGLLEGATIAAASFDAVRGNPVGFARRFGDDLVHASGDEGARRILAEHPDWITVYATDDPGVLRDIDTPADL